MVYVGYTPRYYWSYPYYGVPVYGTGWHYPAYYSPYYYYPYPLTWGMHVGYSYGGGWHYGVSWGSPFFRVGVSWGGYSHGYYGGYHNHNNIVINNTGNINNGNNVNIDKSRVNGIKSDRANNIYKGSRVKDKISTSKNLKDGDFKSSSAAGKANNVLADRNGNVVRKDNDKWQSMDNGRWQMADGRISKIVIFPEAKLKIAQLTLIETAGVAILGLTTVILIVQMYRIERAALIV